MGKEIIKKKSSVAYFVMISLVSIVGVAATVYVWIAVNASMKANLTDRAETIAAIIDSQKVLSLQANPTDLSQPNYIDLKNSLRDIVRANHDVRFIYLMREVNGKFYFLVDSEDPTSPDYSAPGDEFPEASLTMKATLSTGQSQYEISPDRWGWWISSFAPVFDPSTKAPIALIGMDLPAYQNLLTIGVYSVLPLLLTFIIILFIVISHKIQIRDQKYVEQKAEFLSVASHEIRSPLTGIRWATELLLRGNLDEKTRETLNTIHENSVELIRRIGYMLDTDVRDSEDLKRYNMQQADLGSLVNDIIKTLKLTAASKDVTLVVEDNVFVNSTLCCNYESMRQMLANLISNAIKYTNQGTQVTISHTYEDFVHKIFVHDEGNGIDKAEQTKIFEGYRTKSAKESDELGNGLGLYFSQKIALLHNGKIEVESEPGKGSTFILTLKC